MKTENKRAFIIHFIYLFIWAGIIFCILQYGLPLIAPFLLAFFIASLVQRPAMFLSKKLNINYKAISMIILLLLYGCIGFLLSFLGIGLIAGVKDFFDKLPQIYTSCIAPGLSDIFNAAENHILRLDISLFQSLEDLELQLLQSGGTLISNLSLFVVEQITLLAASLPGLFIKTLLMLISSFFITADYACITEFCLNQLHNKAKTIFYQVKNYVVNTLLVCLRSYILIMMITFSELLIGLWLLGVDHFILIAFLIAFFDILPVLGVGSVLIPWCIISILQDNYSLAIGLLILYIIITVIRNILEPKIVGKQIGLHPVATLASMFIGAQLFGILGLFGLPICLSLLLHLNTIGVIHIFRRETAEHSDSNSNSQNDKNNRRCSY